jgi:hypothetical protein
MNTINRKTNAVIRIPVCLIKSRIPCVPEHRSRYCPVRPRGTRKNPDERNPWYNKRRYFPLVKKRTVCFQSNNVKIWTFWSVISISFNYIMFLRREDFEILARRRFFCYLLEVSCFKKPFRGAFVTWVTALVCFYELMDLCHGVVNKLICLLNIKCWYVRPLAIRFQEHNLGSIWPTLFKLHRMIVHIEIPIDFGITRSKVKVSITLKLKTVTAQ